MPLADFVVVEIMSRRYLDAAGAELGLYVVVGDYRDSSAHYRQDDFAADEPGVAVVLGMDRDGAVAEHRLRSRRGDDQVALAGGERVFEMPEFAGLVFREDLEIGQCGVKDGIPVDESFAPVDQTFVIQFDEDLHDRLRQAFVHREAIPAPVDGGAHASELLLDLSPGMFFPLPDPLDELFPAEVTP